MLRRYFTPGDVVLIAILLLASLASIALVGGISGGGVAVVEVDGRSVLELPLDRNVVTTVTGPVGETEIVVENGKVRVADSDCPNHYCVRMGDISRPGEVIVCVPNRVFVRITGGADDMVLDGVTQ